VKIFPRVQLRIAPPANIKDPEARQAAAAYVGDILAELGKRGLCFEYETAFERVAKRHCVPVPNFNLEL
jgi:hypothetical protein